MIVSDMRKEYFIGEKDKYFVIREIQTESMP